MDDLKEIYERMKFLRRKGVKMKDIAECTGMIPSVLSALFTTVLPEYVKNRDKGKDEDESLDAALVWVNNVSKKKLLGSIGKMKAALFKMEAAPKTPVEKQENIHIGDIADIMKGAVNLVTNFSGVYLSYSVSSSSDSMKVEPYLIAPSEHGD